MLIYQLKNPKKAILTCALKFLISHQSQKSFPKNYVINTEQLHFWGVQGAVRFIEGCSNRSKKDWDHNEFWCLWPEWDFPNLRDIKTQVSPFFRTVAYNWPSFKPWIGKTPWKREWLPTAVLLPGEFHGHQALAWWTTVHGGSQRVRQDWATNTFTFIHLKKFVLTSLFALWFYTLIKW